MFRVRHLPHGRYRVELTLSFEPRQGRIALAFVVSVLLHALFFMLSRPVTPPPDFKMPGPLDVTIVESPAPQKEEVATATPAPAAPAPRPSPPQRVARAHPTPAPRIAEPTPQPPMPVPSPVPAPTPPIDMLAMLNARRQQRRAEQAAAAPSATAPGPQGAETAEQRSLAALNRNLKSLSGGQEGVGGIFEILRMGPRTGEFAFNGWFPERRHEWREVIEVDAGDHGDIQRAMVDRMIDLIRQHYKGDFNWRSQRQDKVVVLSARPEDQAELEEYLVREFFGTPLVKRQ
ncbi:MAG TPA: hypothetical protein VFE23_05385 [Usitatibacter sp.]|nr:hypothetical protein [Usitatibacter sp.]